MVNAGKLSASVKFSEPAGRAVLADLVRWADVVVDSLSPRALRSLGLDEAHLREVNPDVITLSASLFGQDGPLARLAGYGNLGAALAGFYDLTGWPDREPAGPYLAYTDYTSSHLTLLALLAALDHRRRTGEGQSIDLSQSEAALHYLSPALLDVTVNGRVTTRRGNEDDHLAPHGVFPCAGEDQWVAIACQDDAAWPALCELMARPDLAADSDLAEAAGRLGRRRELDEAVAAWTRGATPAEVQDRCQGAGVAAHTVQRSAECLADPQLLHQGHFVELEHPFRLCLVEATRFRLARTPGRPAFRAPLLGEHTFEVLSGLLGYDEDRIADLAAAEVLE
ncbi:MAG: CoA transferase [Acidimicrobiia bacterium]|nr:CoA transferase [Acidimicrobiia bacterium]